MTAITPDLLVSQDNWSDLSQYLALPDIDHDRLHRYRQGRLRDQMRSADVDVLILLNPLSLRYAIDYRTYGLFQSRIPTTYLFLALDGPTIINGAYGVPNGCDAAWPGRPTNAFDGGPDLAEAARMFADDVVRYLGMIGATRTRIAIEGVNPSITMALLQRGIDVVDGGPLAEVARMIKNEDEIACIRWAVAVAELGIAKMHQAMRPGISEQQLWGLLNYTNLANDGDWHDGRMLASGPRTNPWLQEASSRRIEAGDLVAFDTDMVGPHGYFADVSRTFFCGPGKPTRRQKDLYRFAMDEIEHNLTLMRPGMTLFEIQEQSYPVPEEFHAKAYPCIIHAVGMCDELPRVNPGFRGPNPYDGVLEPGMVICVESYMGAVGERDGVKLEEQILITDTGYDVLSSYPLDSNLLDQRSFPGA